MTKMILRDEDSASRSQQRCAPATAVGTHKPSQTPVSCDAGQMSRGPAIGRQNVSRWEATGPQAMRRMQSAVVALIVCGVGRAASGDQLAPPKQICGHNSLYALLSLEGHHIQFSRLQSVLESTARGTDMASMQSAARAMGVATAVQSLRIDELADVTKPFIAHLHGKQGQAGAGHFVVVHEVRDSGVEIIDGTTGANRRMRMSRFLENWSGYVLTLEGDVVLSRGTARFSALLATLLCCYVAGRIGYLQHQQRDMPCT